MRTTKRMARLQLEQTSADGITRGNGVKLAV